MEQDWQKYYRSIKNEQITQPLNKRAVESILVDELNNIKTNGKVLEIELENGNLIEIYGHNSNRGFMWTMKKSSGKISSDTPIAFLYEIINYPVKSVRYRQENILYSKKKITNRLKQMLQTIHYLNSL